jgi:hypothetical protein
MRQGTADLPDRASVLAYKGPPGEPIWDGEALRLQDGQTPGGIPLATRSQAAADAASPLATPALLRGAVVLNASMTTAAKNAAIADGIAAGQKAIEFKLETHVDVKTVPGALGEMASLIIANSTDLTVIGNGAKLLFDGADMAAYADHLSLKNNRHLTLKDFTLDYKSLPFVQATCVSKTANSATFVQDAAYDDADRMAFAWRTCQRIEGFNPVSSRYTISVLELNGQANGAGSGKLPPGNYRNRTITVNPNGSFAVDFSDPNDAPQLGAMTVGRHYLLQHQVYGASGVRAEDNIDVTFDNVVVFTCAGEGIEFGGGTSQRDIRLINGAGVRIRPSTGRVQSTTADALHFMECGGIFQMFDAYAQGSRDDNLNLYRYDNEVRSISGSMVGIYSFRPWVKGHLINFIAPDGTLAGQSRITSDPIPDGANTLYQFGDGVPNGTTVGWVLQSHDAGAQVEIARSFFGKSRGRGIIGGAKTWRIRDSLFEDIPANAAIAITQDFLREHEGPMPQEVDIARNRFLDCNIVDDQPGSDGAYGSGVVVVGSYSKDATQPSPAGQIGKYGPGVQIKSNFFGRTAKSAIVVFGAAATVVDDNTYLQWGTAPTFGGRTDEFGLGAYAVALVNVSGGKVGANEAYLGSGKRVDYTIGQYTEVTQREYRDFAFIGASGGTYVAPERCTVSMLAGSSVTFAAETVYPPANPTNNDLWTLIAGFNVTALTVLTTDGSSVSDSPQNYAAKTSLRYVYNRQQNTWYLQ